jgi:hypothetical protein
LTALLCVVFVLVEHPFAVTASTVGISLSSSVRHVSSLAPVVSTKRLIAGHVGCAIWVRDGFASR